MALMLRQGFRSFLQVSSVRICQKLFAICKQSDWSRKNIACRVKTSERACLWAVVPEIFFGKHDLCRSHVTMPNSLYSFYRGNETETLPHDEETLVLLCPIEGPQGLEGFVVRDGVVE